MKDEHWELMELAAKAAEIELVEFYDGFHDVTDCPNKIGRTWNPIDSDTAAFRLAIKLGIEIDPNNQGVSTAKYRGKIYVYAEEPHDGDPYAATRLAIVRVAAEIGRRLM